MGEGDGILLLARARGGYRDALRRYAVLVDGVQVGRVARGETVRFELPAGVHRLQLKIDWCTSPARVAVVEAGRTVCFACAPGGDATEGLAAVGAGSGDYITLERTPEPVEKGVAPTGGRARLQLGAAFGFFAGCFAVIGAWGSRLAGAAPDVAGPVLVAGLGVVIVSMIVFRLARRR